MEEWNKLLGKYCVHTAFFKNYRIVSTIGEGSYSVVYEAYQARKFKRVAVKSVSKALLQKDKRFSVSPTHNRIEGSLLGGDRGAAERETREHHPHAQGLRDR